MLILTILVFLVILTILVIIHEAGHFFVARKFGIKVEEFGFGFPPRAFGIKRGETIYSINWLPIGGFVKLYGEDDAGGGSIKIKKSEPKIKDIDRAFFAKPWWQRALVVVAGVVMNVLLAIVIYYVFLFVSNFQTTLPLLKNHNFFFVNQRVLNEGVTVTNIAPNSPASDAGIHTPAKILAVNKIPIADSKAFVTLVNNNKGKIVSVTWKEINTGKTITKTMTPRISPPKNQGALGVEIEYAPFSAVVLSYDTPVQKAFSGVVHPFNLLFWQLDMLGGLVGKSFEQKSAAPVSGAVSGPIGIGYAVGNILQIPDIKDKLLLLLNLAGIFSITLAFFNILPIPALDGGRLFFILVEGITGRKVSPSLEAKIHTVGMIALLTLMVYVTYQDILRFVLGKVPIM